MVFIKYRISLWYQLKRYIHHALVTAAGSWKHRIWGTNAIDVASLGKNRVAFSLTGALTSLLHFWLLNINKGLKKKTHKGSNSIYNKKNPNTAVIIFPLDTQKAATVVWNPKSESSLLLNKEHSCFMLHLYCISCRSTPCCSLPLTSGLHAVASAGDRWRPRSAAPCKLSFNQAWAHVRDANYPL